MRFTCFSNIVAIRRSFARIHEVNLKKQGLLPVTFINESDYSLIESGDVVSTEGLNELLRGDGDAPLRVNVIKAKSGEEIKIDVAHTMSPDQLKWLKAGSALNAIRAAKSGMMTQ